MEGDTFAAGGDVLAWHPRERTVAWRTYDDTVWLWSVACSPGPARPPVPVVDDLPTESDSQATA